MVNKRCCRMEAVARLCRRNESGRIIMRYNLEVFETIACPAERKSRPALQLPPSECHCIRTRLSLSLSLSLAQLRESDNIAYTVAGPCSRPSAKEET